MVEKSCPDADKCCNCLTLGAHLDFFVFLSSNPCTEDSFKIRNSVKIRHGIAKASWSVTLGHCEEPAWVSSFSEEMFFKSERHNLMNLLFYFFYFSFVINFFICQ